MPAKGIKKQVLGGVLFCLGIMTALLSRMIGFELDIFYVVISIVGAGLFLYGAIQKNSINWQGPTCDRLCTSQCDY